MTVETVGRFVLGRGGDIPLKQGLDDLVGLAPLPCQLKDHSHIGGGFLVRLHAAIRALLVAIGTELALILPPAELHILGALVLDGQVPAVKLADQIFERHIDAARVPMELVAVKIIVDGNEAHTVQRENHFHKVPHFNAVSPKPGKILHDNTVDLALPHLVKQFLDGWPLKIGPAVPIVDKLQDLRVFNALHSVNVLVERVLLVLNAETTHLAVLGGKSDIEGNHIGDQVATHSPAPPSHAQNRRQRRSQWTHHPGRLP